jgi:hypothetical protein
MRGPLHLVGKLGGPGRLNAVAAGQLIHKLDQVSNRGFLVDTRASYSILPHRSSLPASGPKLYGPAGQPIPCWGERLVLPLPSHVAAIQDFPRPSIIKELQAFLGMVNFYRRFLPSIPRTLRPLTDALRGGRKGADRLELSAAMEAAFAPPSSLSSWRHTWHIPQWGRSCQWFWTLRRHT